MIYDDEDYGSGIISTNDLKNYQTKNRVPIEFDYKNHHVISFAPPSSGGILIAQMMKMIAPFDIAKMGYQSPEAVGLMVESQRRAYADRAEHMGDPDFWKVPTRNLISDTYAKPNGMQAMFSESGKAGSALLMNPSGS